MKDDRPVRTFAADEALVGPRVAWWLLLENHAMTSTNAGLYLAPTYPHRDGATPRGPWL